MKNNEIVPYAYPAKDLSFKKPDKPEDMSSKVVSELVNSYKECCFVDKRGQVWFEATKIHSILRTNKVTARYRIFRISDDSKMSMDNKTYILGYEILKLIDESIQKEHMGKKELNLKFSEALYKAIRDCPEARELRTEYNLKIKEERKELKKRRISKYKIKFDELTGEALVKNTAEFSHIRSFAIFNEIASDVENGLIVNKETHALITDRGISDENELLKLCIEMGWNTQWYERYKKYFELS